MTSCAAQLVSASLAAVALLGCHPRSRSEAAPDAEVDGGIVRDSSPSSGDGASAPEDGSLRDAGEDGTLCSGLFGDPNAHTGLTAKECSSRCVYASSTFIAPVYDGGFIQSLIAAWAPASPYAPLTSNPYDGRSADDDPPAMVCGVLPNADAAAVPRLYQLVTYDSADAAAASGARVTNFGHCGVCSTLANLAVYMSHDDLVAPVRSCGLQAAGSVDADVGCLEQLGFDLPCAQAWAYDTEHTSEVCLSICITRLSDPYNLPDGGLDPCLACDEDLSGPVFKQVAGRTRRNSGLPNAICRPCSQVQPLIHSY